MGTLADSLFNVLMGWVRALVNGIWALFTTDHTTLLEFLGKNWIMIVVVILAAGLAIQLFVIRCPECGAHLLSFPGEYCKYCGNRLDWDKPPRF